MTIEDDLVEVEPGHIPAGKYREITDEDLPKIFAGRGIFNKEMRPYQSFEDYLKSRDNKHTEEEWRTIYENHKALWEHRSGLQYIFLTIENEPNTMAIIRLFEDEFDTFREKYLINTTKTIGMHWFKLKD